MEYPLKSIMEQANHLMEMLDECNDLDFIDRVVDAVRYHEPFGEDDIAEVS